MGKPDEERALLLEAHLLAEEIGHERFRKIARDRLDRSDA